MRFSQPEQISQSSFSFLKAQLDDDTRKRRVDERNSIKINRRKLPSDFFKRSVEKSLTRKSPFDPQFNRSSNERSVCLVKSPQTERKINSFHFLPSSEPEYGQGIDLGRTMVLKSKDEDSNILHRRVLQKRLNRMDHRVQTPKSQKFPDCVRPKSLKVKLPGQKISNNEDLKKIINQKSTVNSKNLRIQQQLTQRKELIDMGCTFGRGFGKNVTFSLQNSFVLRKQNENSQKYVDEQIENDEKSQLNISIERKQGFEKSTEESQLTQELKSQENSPIKTKNGRKLFKAGDDTPHFQHKKQTSAHWDIFKQDLSSFQDLPIQNSKAIFTAEEKQRKIKYRINNSSKECRQSSRQRKEKKMDDLNLPRIGKVNGLPGIGQM